MPKSFDGYATSRLMAVARAVTPADDLENWTLTASDRVWRREGDNWISVSAVTGRPAIEYGYAVTLPDLDMRENVFEQLERYGVQPDGWQMEAH